jgi:hypothetical protein
MKAVDAELPGISKARFPRANQGAGRRAYGPTHRILRALAWIGTLASMTCTLTGNAAPSSPNPATAEPPLFDAHIHYNQDVWASIPPSDAIALLDAAGIDKAFVSSTPTEGTERLYALAPDRVIPLLRPYRTPADRRTWFEEKGLVDRLEETLATFPYRGIGEFHVFGANASTPDMGAMIRLAEAHGLFLQAHADREGIERILAQADVLTLVWAHAGFDVPVAELAELLDRYPNLVLELSYRNDIAPNGRLSPAWEALFIAHPDRFLVGMDTHVDDRWHELSVLAGEARVWLAQLPDEVARKIAFENAADLSGRF